MKQERIMYSLNEFYNEWNIDVKPHSNNDVMVVLKGYEVIKVLQDGINILQEKR